MNSGVPDGSPEGKLIEQQLWKRARAAGISRHSFLGLLAAGGAAAVLAACGQGAQSTPTLVPTSTPQPVPVAQVVLPPPDAKVVPTACDYCVVGCGYQVYTWPVGKEGGPKAADNALGIDFPAPVLSGKWISPNMHNVIQINGEPHHVLVLPEEDTRVLNGRGDHSVRGGTLSQKLYSADTPTRDRLQQPQLRVDGRMVPISWDVALSIVADVSRYVLDKYSELAWGMKTYSYNYYENTYAVTKRPG